MDNLYTVDGSTLTIDEKVKNPFKSNSELVDFFSTVMSSVYAVGANIAPDLDFAPLWIASTVGSTASRVMKKWEEQKAEKDE